MLRLYEQWAIKIARAERQILKEIRAEQIVTLTPERIEALWPDGLYDTSKVNRVSGDVLVELKAIRGTR